MRIVLLFYILSICVLTANGQIITTVVGNGMPGHTGDGGPATAARIHSPVGCCFDKYGNFYFAEYHMHRIRKVDVNGVITTIAGTSLSGYNGDGILATAARLFFPNAVIVDTIGDVFISDGNNCRIRKVEISTGLISTIAGDGTPGFWGDGGLSTNAKLNYPGGICFDSHGNLFISDPNNRRLRKVAVGTGIIDTYAGNGAPGVAGDGGLATAAEITPGALCIDTSDNVYIADYTSGQTRIARVDHLTNIISTIAGTDTGYVYNGEGIAATAANISPSGLVFDDNGNLFMADGYNDMVRKITPAGYIYNVAGTGVGGYSGDGFPAVGAQLDQPYGVVFDKCGNLHMSESNNARIRKVTFNPYTTPTITVTGISSTTVGSTVTVNATISGASSTYSIKWFRNSVLFSTTSTPTTTYTKGPGIDTITARVVPAATYCFDSTMSPAHYITVPVGVDDISGTTAVVNIYPNPSHDVITISTNGTLLHNVSISNLLGCEVVFKEGTGTEMQLPIGHLPQGVYLLRVNGVYVRRFVRE